MNGPTESTDSRALLPTPRTSLQNIGEKKDDDERVRGGQSFQAFGADGFTFLDFLDIINPLQHIPGVSTLYRGITGDEIDPGSRIAGGTLFGGPIGTVVSLANVSLEQRTGQDMGEHMMAWLGGGEEDGQGVELANPPPPKPDTPTAPTPQPATSPITAHADVLEWARREVAHASQTQDGPGDEGEAALKSPPPVPAGTAHQVAANIEVLQWARREAALGRSAVETATAAGLDRRQEEKRAPEENRLLAENRAFAQGRSQAQLGGATAPLGGWFSETMILALSKYDEGGQLAKARAGRQDRLDIRQ